MKTKLMMLILAGVLLVGCASNEEAEVQKAPEETQQETVQQEEPKQEAAEAEAQDESAGEQDNPAGADSQQAAADGEAVAEGEYVLKFTAKTIDGEEMTSDIFAESKITMINVWATYCNPCVQEMPALGEIAESYDKSDLQIIGIISDVQAGAAQADIDQAKSLIETRNANYPNLLLNHSLVENLVNGVTVVPSTFFVNSKGEPLGYIIGANDKETWIKIIEDLLKQENAANEQEQ